MARTIMVADAVYAALKKAKGSEMSFSEVIRDSLEAAKGKKKLGKGLVAIAGILKGDTEYAGVMKWAGKKWKEWDRRYA
ncbi:MAG: antitoxin VapB family protein [Candidatus Woesearchaeota archaeon]